jgi:hypothetical protein
VNASTTLRRSSLALVRLRGPARTQARRSRAAMGFAPPAWRFYAFQVFDQRAVPQPKLRAALLELSLLFRAQSPGPRAVPPVSQRDRRHFLSWTLLALRHISAWRIRFPTANPFAAAYRVRGLITSCATSTPKPTDASSASEHPWASPFKVFPSSRSVPLSGPIAFMPLPPAPHLPGGRCERPGRLQGLLLATSPCGRQDHKGLSRRYLPGVLPSRACSRSSLRSL